MRYIHHTKPHHALATKPEITLSIPCPDTRVFIGVSALSWCGVKGPSEFIRLTTGKFLSDLTYMYTHVHLNTSYSNFDVYEF